jgi:hypothetical protein
MVSITSAAAGVKFCRSADSRHIRNSERSRLFLDTSNHHQHRPDRLEWQSDQLESESSQRDWFNRQQLHNPIDSKLDDHERHKFGRRKSEQHEPDRRDGNFGQHQLGGQQLGQSEFAQLQQPELEQ